MRGCVDLRRARRELRLRRMLPGLACMGGLFGVSMPLPAAVYDLDAEWIDFATRRAAKVEDPAS